jgi:integrase
MPVHRTEKVPINIAFRLAWLIIWQHRVAPNCAWSAASLLPDEVIMEQPVHQRLVAAAKAQRPKKALNDRGLKALKHASKGETYDVWDALVPGLGVRVSEAGRKTFILATRYPGSASYTRRSLGIYGALSLEKARTKARDWIELIRKGVDPWDEEERQRIEQQRKRANSFRVMAEAYVAQAVIGSDPDRPKMRKAAEVKRNIEKEFIYRWGDRPVADIAGDDVAAAIEAVVARGSPGQARNLLGIAKTLFGWAARQRRFGLKASPVAELKGKHLIGAKRSSDRILSDIEIAAFWRNADRLGYPYAAAYKLLLLSGLRLNEVADAVWRELDFKEKIWTLPKERMKGTDEKARAHTVPLTNEMLAIFEPLPRSKGGDFLFSTSGGKTPVWMSDKIKKKLDRRMMRSLRALARMRGDDPGKMKLAPWTNHDLRRTLRSGLSRLRIDHDVKEAILGHVKPGIARVYDHYDLLDERRDALERWAARLREIISPPPDNVVKLPAARA